jgi:ElaB/YqjD/DUF883 family membrane-anchored ribosome-binding protein
MDDYTNQGDQKNYGNSETTGGTGTGAKMKLADTAASVKETVAGLGRKAVDSIESSRQPAANALASTASSLHSGGDQISSAARTAGDQLSGVAHSTADKLQATADYVRQTDLKTMGSDITNYVKQYPGAALAVAAALGFLLARSMRSSD